MKERNSLGVVIGRFQIHELHDGHIFLLDHVKERHPEMLILVGHNSFRLNPSDPFPFDLRKDMLKSQYPDAMVLPIEDVDDESLHHPKTVDEVWSQAVDEAIKSLSGPKDAVLYGSRDSFIPKYSGKFKTKSIPDLPGVSATEAREKAARELINDPLFRMGWLAAINSLHVDEDSEEDISK